MDNYSMDGRTYRYFKGPGNPLYPFGYGLSYSKFIYKNLSTNLFVINQVYKSNITVEADVYNLGPYDSDEVTQIYIAWNDIPVSMPKLQLVAVQRNSIIFDNQPFKLSLIINVNQLKIWDETKGFYLHPG
ncbi:hypothetical protein HELRODRAFT_67165 [Helobdella robusta]|uniref:beta-glucosidase n=1 Tax=Helobdella robusta TaxID=6412 RepID=T1FYX8_HELRO|nr:hypothetical protein HELRODRAFT_67165 [Helobdella robusta]ESN99353.1 hypothetical protein HELRODRAFT_67165 [Helobdella robusta]